MVVTVALVARPGANGRRDAVDQMPEVRPASMAGQAGDVRLRESPHHLSPTSHDGTTKLAAASPEAPGVPDGTPSEQLRRCLFHAASSSRVSSRSDHTTGRTS